MEDVLELYAEPIDPLRPRVCLDETPYQLLVDVHPTQPPVPGQVARQDYEYARAGTCNLFVLFQPDPTHRHNLHITHITTDTAVYGAGILRLHCAGVTGEWQPHPHLPGFTLHTVDGQLHPSTSSMRPSSRRIRRRSAWY